METDILTALQMTSMFPNIILQNFYVDTQFATDEGRTKAPYAFVIPVQARHDEGGRLVEILRIQGIELRHCKFRPQDQRISTYKASWSVIKRDTWVALSSPGP